MFRRTMSALVALVPVVAFGLVLSFPSRAGAQPPDEAAPFFDNTVLHDLYFTINSKDWQTLRDNYLDNTYYPVDVKWGAVVIRNAGIRSRGTGSRSGAKPGLRVDFDRYTASQKFLGLKSVVMRNSTQDPTNMHEQLGMLNVKRLGLAAPREMYARLFINNTYPGPLFDRRIRGQDISRKTFGKHPRLSSTSTN